MKVLLLSLCAAFVLGAAVVVGSPIGQQHGDKQQPHLLGRRECSWGPSYWCYNITNAAGCGATKHCIQTVWEKHTVAKDTDSICQICLDMVEQARDQLRSNVTQEDLKAVFEGSCNLLPLKPVRKMCINLADNFVPELVEALSSQMEPHAVCSIAGLCNNAAIDKMLAEQAQTATTTAVQNRKTNAAAAQLSCKQCRTVGAMIVRKFRTADRDQMLAGILQQCGRLSSFSDACASLVLTHFSDVYAVVSGQLTTSSICHMAGSCVAQFHRHEEDESSDSDGNDDDDDDDMPLTEEQLDLVVRPMGSVGVVKVNDDIPCELCKQLVHHLKDLLIANTTETEFKSVLTGLCKQTHGFTAECLSLVDQYYGVIYNTLLTDLNENEACCLIEICPRGLTSAAQATAAVGELRPLLPALQAQHLYVTITAKPKVRKQLGADEPLLGSHDIQRAQLPIDRLLGAPNGGQLVEGGSLCPVCEYAAHFVQTALANAQNEAEIKQYIKKMCDEITPKLRTQCDAFVDSYGDALIALAIQQIDPSQICPRMFVCAAQREADAEVLPLNSDAVQINEQRRAASEQCPLCLFAVAQAVAEVKKDRSVQHIQYVLDRLCAELPGKMKSECSDFVATYTPELVRMLADDFTPQAICTNLKLCDPQRPTSTVSTLTRIGGGNILTNEIPDITFDGHLIEAIALDDGSTPNCLLCVELVKQVEKRVSNKKSRAQLKEALEHACAKMPKLTNKCDQLVDKYGDHIVDLIIAEFTPKQICRELGQCVMSVQLSFATTTTTTTELPSLAVSNKHTDTDLVDMAYVYEAGRGDDAVCVLCETVMEQLERQLKDKSTQKEIEDTVKNICHSLPRSYDAQCSKFIDQYAALIITLIDSTPPKQLCATMGLCTAGRSLEAAVGATGVKAEKFVAESKLEITECAVCHAATMSMAKLLEDPNVERSVEHVLDRVCNKLPGVYNSKCVTMVQAYGQSMMNIIASSSELQTLCTKIGMCYANEYRSFAQITEA